ncbi:hypothetical protein [Neobacillus sp. YIM B06451]|uniref:hypothetical protein n=1 Tax=Neobacillus sp. YIM B06451 TaxID=3070994 RepID=UPI002930575D|nr:hypothetical protein [Neobacillus sp. YIM B06451]
MIAAFLQLSASFIGGYLFIEWVEIGSPFYAHVFVMGLILSPVEFLAAAIAFFSVLTANWLLLKPFLTRNGSKRDKKKYSLPAFTGILGIFLVFAVLFVLSPVHTVVLFGSSLVYGIISMYA